MQAHRQKRSETRDNYIHYALKNWSAYVRKGKTDGPREHAQSASWQGQVSNRVQSIDQPEPHYIDEPGAELIHRALVRCRKMDVSTAIQLVAHYRDNLTVDNLRKCRNKFWRFL